MDWNREALDCGFTYAVTLDVNTLQCLQSVRDACAADKCRSYDKNWTCPPACGTLEACEERLRRYGHGILLQTVGKLDGAFDARGMLTAMEKHKANFDTFAERMRAVWPDALPLGAGGCTVCKKCAYPEPCRFPEKALSSMEAYGLFVAPLCKENGLQAHYGKDTLTYVACVLYD